ncbi:alcohol dehydrogenase catalytic domain-containing protein [Aestuariicella sp. G3-2]|uniref:zinc-dependent alcohol dehydrogenase n=1 Tax=Pseudomaricurvus albidus TaxID=2842452 RepID=UPI001C0C3E59|nr:alcohol dehydrogenase catalytic domain-containing protein [Aestuariicella albida]MBU3071306.1 alcohol dehydrogenase catalytic domain-containing protein [Aestuariicella albida]
MRQLTFTRQGTLEWHDVPAPRLTSDKNALVRPLAVARCDLDYYIALGLYRTRGPFALGHEITAVIESVGDDVTNFVPGDRVIVPFQINCGECDNCLRGWTNACSSVPPCAAYGLGTNPDGDFGGGFSDCLLVPFADAMLVHLPDSLSPEAGAGLSDNVADGYRTVATGLKEFPGEPVLIAGGLAQSVGLYAVHAAIALGSRRVVYVDTDTRRLYLAKLAGAETVHLESYKDESRHSDDFLITVDTAGTAEGLCYALASTAPCGYCTGVSGGLTPTTELPLSTVYLRGITYTVSRVHGRALLPETLHHACCGTIDPLALADHILTFDDCIEAMVDPAPKLIFRP